MANENPVTSEVIDTRALRSAFGLFATGVTIVTGFKPDGEPVGVTANSFTSVSLNPPLVLWCLQNESTSFDAFVLGRPFVVNMLRRDHERQAMHFARRAGVKFPPGSGLASATRPPRIEGALCRLECVVEARHDGGDHTIILGRVLAFEVGPGEPLLFHGGVFGRFQPEPQARHVEAWETFGGEWF